VVRVYFINLLPSAALPRDG
jgi:hypothetical protein